MLVFEMEVYLNIFFAFLHAFYLYVGLPNVRDISEFLVNDVVLSLNASSVLVQLRNGRRQPRDTNSGSTAYPQSRV